MSAITTIAIYEFTTALQRRSTQVVLIIFPLFSLLSLFGFDWLVGRQEGSNTDLIVDRFTTTIIPPDTPLGLVPLAPQINTYPPNFDNYFIRYNSATDATTAYNQDLIRGFYFIPTDFDPATDRITYFSNDADFNFTELQLLQDLLITNWVTNTHLATRLITDNQINQLTLAPDGSTNSNDVEALFALGIAVSMLFYITSMGAAGYLLHGLGSEKENRVLEILISSTAPRHLLIGKILGLGGVGLVQMAVWAFFAIFVLGDYGPLGDIDIPPIPPTSWLLIVLHFLAGYLVYASLYAGIGAILPTPRDSAAISFFMSLPTMLPLWFGTLLLTAPNGNLALFMSFFPLTTGVVMPMRLTVTDVPPLQWLASLFIALATTAIIINLVTRLFRAQTLLAGHRPTLKDLWRALTTA
ncbi:MAG TPA: ABC transporter permease [Anaerolineae bacterium]|nr:ABC transporter permease [Anaerolineae bacterium]